MALNELIYPSDCRQIISRHSAKTDMQIQIIMRSWTGNFQMNVAHQSEHRPDDDRRQPVRTISN